MTGRFAPTPSGRMHLGNAYAMLAAWLSARTRGERMVLRMEDIDEPRVLPDADRWIMDDLHWLGLDWDGEPVYQSARIDIYDEIFRRLRERGGLGGALIYPCFCSRADIRAASAPQEGDRFFVYPGTCRRLLENDPQEVARRLADGKRHSFRLAVPPAGSAGSLIEFDDRVFGAQSFDIGREIGDTIMRRSDGLYSYQFVVTVDDLLMGVSDIVRGRDLLRSTALQIWLREQLLDCGVGERDLPSAVPQYAHLPLVDNAAGVRLAKRERSLDLGVLRAQGVKPEQIIGYCAWLLGLCGEAQAIDEREFSEGTGSRHIAGMQSADDFNGEGAFAARPGKPVPMSAQEALQLFSWRAVKQHTADVSVPADVADVLRSL